MKLNKVCGKLLPLVKAIVDLELYILVLVTFTLAVRWFRVKVFVLFLL